MEEIGLPDWFKEARGAPCPSGTRVGRSRFIDRTLGGAASAARGFLGAGGSSDRAGLLQRTGPAGRLGGIIVLMLAAAVSDRWEVLAGLVGFNLLLCLLSLASPWAVAKRTLPAIVFTIVLAVPVFFDFITPGRAILGFRIGPLSAAVTAEGLRTGLFFILRVAAMVSFVSLAVVVTKQAEIFRGLRGLPVPAFFTTALFMTGRYLLILLKTVEYAALARRSRTIDEKRALVPAGPLSWFASRVGLVLRKSMKTADDVALAMTARGFDGRLRGPSPGRLGAADFVWLGAAFFALFISIGL